LLQFLDGSFITLFAAKNLIDNFHGGADVAEWLEFQNLGIFNGANALIGVFVEKRGQDRPGLLAVFGEVVAFSDLIGPLFSGERRLIIRDMADKVKVAIVFADLFGKIVENDAVIFQEFEDGLLFTGGVPSLKKFVQ
jgi:hypothetical protein